VIKNPHGCGISATVFGEKLAFSLSAKIFHKIFLYFYFFQCQNNTTY
jgi:hypothetical protein